MKDCDVQIGQVVLSVSGRDKGTHFIVCEVLDGGFVRIADGKTRKIVKPKLKKIKHLKLKPYVLQKVAEKINQNKAVNDSEIAKGLKVFDKEKGENE